MVYHLLVNVRENNTLTRVGEHLTSEWQRVVGRIERMPTDALVLRAIERQRIRGIGGERSWPPLQLFHPTGRVPLH